MSLTRSLVVKIALVAEKLGIQEGGEMQEQELLVLYLIATHVSIPTFSGLAAGKCSLESF